MEFFATCARGLEAVLGDELRALRIPRVRPLSGGVSFEGELESAYTALLWSRVASRVLLTLGRIDAPDSDSLYEGVRRIDWKGHVGQGRTIAVAAHGTNAQLRDTRYSALVAKDAICDELRERTGSRPDVDAASPDVLVNVAVNERRAVISIDLAGTPLEERGYAGGKPAGTPLHATLAAAALLKLGWADDAAQVLSVPFCADGTLVLEAALMAADRAPGALRSRWGFQGWLGHDEDLWQQLVDAADERAEAGAGNGRRVIAVLPEGELADAVERKARRMAVAGHIERVESVAALPAPAYSGCGTALIAAALLTGRELPAVLLPSRSAALDSFVRCGAGPCRLALVADDPQAAMLLAMEQTGCLSARNGAHAVELCVYESTGEQRRAQVKVRDAAVAVSDAAAQQFADRLKKNLKSRRAWSSANGIFAYRLYDADLPDYNVAIDVYMGAGPDAGRTLVHVAEYAPPKKIDPAKATRRLGDALRIVSAVLEVPPEQVYVKRRVRAKGGSQYARQGEQQRTSRFVTSESGLLFEVDLADYLDTGLFLDHRPTRQLIGKLAKGRSFLNLFSYTGTASVYAAAGKATFTTTVDLSNTYLQWARRNMELNGLLNDDAQFVRADVLAWTREMRHSRNRWDLIFVDPPTFSNSAKMGKRSWDVQRDHAELLITVSRLLTRTGAAVFSCNLRGFELDVQALAKAGVQAVDITPDTIPEDYARNPKVHRCYLLRRR